MDEYGPPTILISNLCTADPLASQKQALGMLLVSTRNPPKERKFTARGSRWYMADAMLLKFEREML